MSSLAPVTLLLGPPGATGAMAGLLHDEHGGYLVRVGPPLTADLARGLVESAPIRYHSRYFYVVDLGRSTEAAQNILLKLLEEPPPHCAFVLLAVSVPLPTVVSRSLVVHLAEPPGPQPALDADAARARSVVSAAIRAAVHQGAGALDMAVRNWGPEHTAVLGQWALEAATGRWAAFSEDFAPGVPPVRAMRVIEVLSQYSSVRTGGVVALAAMARGPK